MINLNVSYMDQDGMVISDDEISRAFLASHTEKAVIIRLETATKYPQPLIYSGNGCVFNTKKNNRAKISVDNLPFNDVIVMAQPGRYNLYLIMFQDVQDDSVEIPTVPKEKPTTQD